VKAQFSSFWLQAGLVTWEDDPKNSFSGHFERDYTKNAL
jgi:hypothetical protein